MPEALGSFADTLRRAIGERGLGLERIHAHLDRRGAAVSIATLSYWQSGRSQPERRTSMDAIPHLEEILGLAPGELLATLPSTRDRARRAEVLSLDAVWPEPSPTTVLARLDTRWDEQLDRVSLHDVLVIGRDRRQESLTVRQVLRARADGPDRRVVLHCHDDPAGALPTVEPLQGCRVAALESDGGRVVGAELEFPRPLRRGETHIVEHRITSGDPGPLEHGYQRRLRMPMRVYVLEVEFHPDATPASCDSFRGDDVRPLPLTGRRVHLVDTDCTAGSTGIRWSWPNVPRPRSEPAGAGVNC